MNDQVSKIESYFQNEHNYKIKKIDHFFFGLPDEIKIMPINDEELIFFNNIIFYYDMLLKEMYDREFNKGKIIKQILKDDYCKDKYSPISDYVERDTYGNMQDLTFYSKSIKDMITKFFQFFPYSIANCEFINNNKFLSIWVLNKATQKLLLEKVYIRYNTEFVYKDSYNQISNLIKVDLDGNRIVFDPFGWKDFYNGIIEKINYFILFSGRDLAFKKPFKTDLKFDEIYDEINYLNKEPDLSIISNHHNFSKEEKLSFLFSFIFKLDKIYFGSNEKVDCNLSINLKKRERIRELMFEFIENDKNLISILTSVPYNKQKNKKIEKCPIIILALFHTLKNSNKFFNNPDLEFKVFYDEILIKIFKTTIEYNSFSGYISTFKRKNIYNDYLEIFDDFDSEFKIFLSSKM